MVQDQQKVFVIRTLECDICQRFDSLLLTELELRERVERNSLQIGSRLLNHGDHLRIIYFDIEGNYLGDTMSLNIKRGSSFDGINEIPLFLRDDKEKVSFQRHILKFLLSTSYTIAIVGPSMAGKTSLTKFLETGAPERLTHRINHPPTMGQSTKRFELSKNKVTIFDMGGQRDFWHLWGNKIEKADYIIYMIDGAANTLDLAIEGLEMLLNKMKGQNLLIIFNKYDLVLDGYTSEFMRPVELIQSLETPIECKYWILQTSVYNGLAYHYVGEDIETPLADAILDFLERND